VPGYNRLSLTTVSFHDQQGEIFVVVGTGKDLTLAPRTSSAGFLRVYRVVDEGRSLELVHKVRARLPPKRMATGRQSVHGS